MQFVWAAGADSLPAEPPGRLGRRQKATLGGTGLPAALNLAEGSRKERIACITQRIRLDDPSRTTKSRDSFTSSRIFVSKLQY
jgi:hypothetical protein